MGKLPYGVPSRHVNQSNGADTNLMKFYSTTNSTTYGRKFSTFEPRQGRHTGTGYLSNFRPGVYYSGRLDELDNPTMGWGLQISTLRLGQNGRHIADAIFKTWSIEGFCVYSNFFIHKCSAYNKSVLVQIMPWCPVGHHCWASSKGF